MEFEWDEWKNLVNAAKHGVAFEEAREAFDDPNGVLIDDLEHSSVREQRYWLIGQTAGRMLLIVFTYRLARARLISARPAHRKERDIYEKKKMEIR